MKDVLWQAGLLIHCTVRQTEVGQGESLCSLACGVIFPQAVSLTAQSRELGYSEASATLLRDSFLLGPQELEVGWGGSQTKARETAVFPSDYGKTVAGIGHLGGMAGCQFPTWRSWFGVALLPR